LEDYLRIIILGKLNLSFLSDYQKFQHIELYEQVDQKTMGKLYLQADLSICRGGVTTLVEQQLFNIKQLIIPIPWTHDQFTNAEYFAKTNGDFLIDQDQSNRVDKIYSLINNLKDFKKNPIEMGKLVESI
jgi:UDP-N-acetylglucosamine:LPS N-acetylglucosamine transferase